MWAPSLASVDGAAERMASFFRTAASPGAAVSIMRMNRDIDARDILKTIRVPTLLLHRTGDRVIDLEHARYMAQRIPNARLVELPGEDHMYWVSAQGALDEIEHFLTGGLQSWVINHGASCSKHFMRKFENFFESIAGGKSTPQATAFLQLLMGRHAVFGAPPPFSKACAPWD
jgi:hypothetical protein